MAQKLKVQDGFIVYENVDPAGEIQLTLKGSSNSDGIISTDIGFDLILNPGTSLIFAPEGDSIQFLGKVTTNIEMADGRTIKVPRIPIDDPDVVNKLYVDITVNNNVTADNNNPSLLSHINVIKVIGAGVPGVSLIPRRLGTRVTIINRTAQSVDIHPFSGATINGLSVIALPTLKSVDIVITSETEWYTITGA